MRKAIGPVVVIDTNPPYREWDGNQATYLFFPVFASFFLVLMSGLSEPIVNGLSVAKVDTGVNGTLSLGTWGWCTKGVPGVDDMCSGNRAFSAAMDSEMAGIPAAMKTFAEISTVIPGSYLIANGIFHIFSALATWLTITWTLAASGSWHNKEVHAWDWTKWSFYGTAWSALFILISWSLDLGMVTRVAGKAMNVDGSEPKVTPGPAVWMMITAFMLNLITVIVRMIWLRRMPRPLWSIKGAGGDFHNSVQPPLSAALPHPDESLPTWESLAIDSHAPIDEKMAYEANLEEALAESEKPSIERRGFAV